MSNLFERQARTWERYLRHSGLRALRHWRRSALPATCSFRPLPRHLCVSGTAVRALWNMKKPPVRSPRNYSWPRMALPHWVWPWPSWLCGCTSAGSRVRQFIEAEAASWLGW